MMINNDYLVWFSAGWMKQNICTACRILHNPIVFRNLLWWGNMPSCLIGSESTRVYVRKATDDWIFLRSYLDFSYVRTGSDDSIYDTSIIEVVDIPCRNSPYYVAYTCTWILEPSVYLSGCKIEWQACVVAYSRDKLLASRAILAGKSIPPIPWLIALSPTTEAIRVTSCGKNWPAGCWGTICGVRIVYYYWNVSLLRVEDIKFHFIYGIHVFYFILFYLFYTC